MESDEKTNQIPESSVGHFKKIRASICKYCPACMHARKDPESVVGRLLHHPMHSKNCPMWKAYEQVYGEADINS